MSKQFLPRLRGRAGLTITALAACGSLALSGCKSAVDSQQEGSGPQKGGTLNIVQSADIAPSTFLSQNNPNFSVDRVRSSTSLDGRQPPLPPAATGAGHELAEVSPTRRRSP